MEYSGKKNHGARQLALSYLEAVHQGDIDKAMTFCDDDIDCIAYAPITIFPHLGHKHGKAAWAESLVDSVKRYSSARYDIVSMLSDDDKVSAIFRYHLKMHNSDRIVLLDVASFFTLRNSLIVEVRSFFDSFDALQQVIGKDLSELFVPSVQNAARP